MDQHVVQTVSHVIIEPFYGGSHKQLIEGMLKLESLYDPNSVLVLTLPAKKWKWRLRSASLHFSSFIPFGAPLQTLFASSMLNLSELLSVRPDLLATRKILYFHENQFEYPVREEIERDGQFGWSQVMSALVADAVLWNSKYNLDSFLAGFKKFVQTMPKDQRPNYDAICVQIRAKSSICYFPVAPPPSLELPPLAASESPKPLHIVWNHRWEWDKGPELFFKALFKLIGAKESASSLPISTSDSALVAVDASPQDSTSSIRFPPFHLSIIGESFGEVPPEFEQAKPLLAPYLLHWGYLESKTAYWNVLRNADIVVSTALHEFFGVSVIEAILCDCFPLCPSRLVFPEYLNDNHLYKTEDQLAKKLRYYIKYPEKLRRMDWKSALHMNRFTWASFEATLQPILQSK